MAATAEEVAAGSRPGPGELPVLRAAAIAPQPLQEQWLVRSLWGSVAVGIVGGAPKTAKSWFGLDMAVSVASGTPCLGVFPVEQPGRALVFLAEDALPMVRGRIDAICQHRSLDIEGLDLHVIAAPTLRLDLATDQERLKATLDHLRPRLLLLDPLVRLHRLDENSASDISGLLGFLRELQRTFDVAVVLVHHASKKQRAQPGQALRGSSDLHAFGDDNAYLARRDDALVLTIEHRAARSPDPISLRLVSRPDGTATHLEVIDPDVAGSQVGAAPIEDLVLRLLRTAREPMPRGEIRTRLRINNQRLGQILVGLEKQAAIVRTNQGWLCGRPSSAPAADRRKGRGALASPAPAQRQLPLC